MTAAASAAGRDGDDALRVADVDHHAAPVRGASALRGADVDQGADSLQAADLDQGAGPLRAGDPLRGAASPGSADAPPAADTFRAAAADLPAADGTSLAYRAGADPTSRPLPRADMPNATPTSHVPQTTPRRTTPTSRSDADPLPPARLPFGAPTWKEIAHLLLNLPVAVFGFVYVVTSVSVSAGLTVTVLGLPLLAGCLLGARLLGRLERARVRGLLGVRVPEPSPLSLLGARDRKLSRRLWLVLRDPVGWRTLLYFFIRLPWGIFTFCTILTSLFVLWPVLSFIARGLAAVDRALARGLLAPSDELERRIAELESDRGVVVDTAAADLRRIERDLHDGAQARLVNLAMELGLAKEKLLEDPEGAARMVDEAHGEVKTALRELRDLARGIHPAVLTDRGLDAALSSIATRCTVPVTVTTDLPVRPAPAIEGIAYYTASELLQNISKHSHAHHATIDLWRTDDRLMLQIRDDGTGGATATPGGGLHGLTERLGAVDGLLLIDSPPGGPTAITAELPWRDRTA